MPDIINVSVENKIATKTDDTEYVCGNSVYVAKFAFDSEWDAYDTKTARFSYNGSYIDIVFTGTECHIPIISDTYFFNIGVYAGNLHTTTPARVPCKKSILCDTGAPADPPDDVYNQIMAKLNSLGSADPEAIAKAVADYLAEHPVEETDPTVPEWAKAEITGATVGQTVKIAAVDASGVPTAWSPVDMPSGGSESTFEKAVEMTTAEDAAVISISTDKNGNPLSMSEFYVAITTARNSAATANNHFSCNVLPDTVVFYIRNRSAIKNIMLFSDVYCYVMHYKVVGRMIFNEYSRKQRTASGLNVAEYLENEKSLGISVGSGETIGFLSPTDTSTGESKIDSAGKMYCITFSADSTECIFGAGTRVEVWAR